jgi:hypothetical protein
MPAFLDRTIEEHKLVGISVAPNLFELALLLDEGIDPGVCEWQRMSVGGIMWRGPCHGCSPSIPQTMTILPLTRSRG